MSEEERKPELTGTHVFNLFAGVILPAISITLEATTHICAEYFFDPIPTVWHLLLVMFVPFAHLQTWFAVRRNAPQRLRLAGVVNAIAIGISIFYSIVYLPIFPFALPLALFGIGLLPLAPYSSLLAGLLMRRHLRQIASTAPANIFALRRAGLLAGLSVTFALIGLIELPTTLTRYGLRLAVSESPETRVKGIRFLRSYGSRDYLLRSCYERTGWATDIIGYLFEVKDPLTPAEAQKIYYRVTGETVDNSAPKRIGGRFIPQEEFDFDADQSGQQVGRKLKELSLSSSKLDGSADADGGIAYIEWTLVFENDSQVQREARAEIQLPPGGVVSRLTLWVDGEEREAAFGGRGQTKQAYQQVVTRRRDPVLVTTAGRDRVLVQCFPVPPNKGEMKIRLGITTPLLLEDLTHARLLLPHFVNRNFRVPNYITHSFWIESKTYMYTDSLMPDTSSSGVSLQGRLRDDDLSKSGASIRLDRAGVKQIWSKDRFQTGGFIVQQSIQERLPNHLQRIVIVVDTSASMSEWVDQIRAAMRALPPQFDAKLLLAEADGLSEITATKDLTGAGPEEISRALRSASFAGGADNTPALLKAWELAAEKPGINAIVWIHSPQLMQLKSVEELRQGWERRPYGPILYSVQVTSGSDEIEKRLDGIEEVKSVPRLDRLQADLERLFARLTGQVETLEFIRSSEKLDHQLDLTRAYETSDHLARLWANDEVTRILKARDQSLNEAATTLAVRYQLVTPVSGAVVLETAEQYRAAGLKPVDPGTVPTIPEPGMLALLAVAGAFLICITYVKYRRTRSDAI